MLSHSYWYFRSKKLPQITNSSLQSPTKSPKKRFPPIENGQESSPKKAAAAAVGATKYGTWRELQKLSKANMKERPAEEDTLKEDVEALVAALEAVEERDRAALADAALESVRANRFLCSLCSYESEYLAYAVEVFAGFGVDEPDLNSRTQAG